MFNKTETLLLHRSGYYLRGQHVRSSQNVLMKHNTRCLWIFILVFYWYVSEGVNIVALGYFLLLFYIFIFIFFIL